MRRLSVKMLMDIEQRVGDYYLFNAKEAYKKQLKAMTVTEAIAFAMKDSKEAFIEWLMIISNDCIEIANEALKPLIIAQYIEKFVEGYRSIYKINNSSVITQEFTKVSCVRLPDEVRGGHWVDYEESTPLDEFLVRKLGNWFNGNDRYWKEGIALYIES